MTSDHQGQAAERATLLVKAVDEVLGTHRVGDVVPCQSRPITSGECGPILLPPRCHEDQKDLTAFRRSGP
jgi:hypothetical protein